MGRVKSWMDPTEDSILQVCQLTELKQTKEWERYPNRFRRLYEILPENLRKHYRKWPVGKTESEIKLDIQENSKPQDLKVYTDGSVTKTSQGGASLSSKVRLPSWRQCGLYGINLQLDSRGGSSHPGPPLDCLKRWQTTHATLTDSMSLLQKVKSAIGSPDWNVSMADIHLRKLLWVYCLGHAEVKGNDRADRMACKAVLSSDLLLERSEVSRSLRHYLWAQSQGYQTIDRLEERGVERGSARRSYLKGQRAPSSVRRTLEPF